MQILVLILGVFIFAVVAYGDIRTRRIPNELVVAILALAAFRIALARDPSAALYTLAASVALFAATFLLFWRGLLGGGDVKLLVATGFLIGYHDLFQFLFVMSICGALVALAVVAHNRLGGAAAAGALEHQEPPEPPARLTVPYGVAISVAGIVTLLAQSFPPG